MNDLHDYDAWDDDKDEPRPLGSSRRAQTGASGASGRSPRTAITVLVGAAVLLVIALVMAMSALRPPAPETVATARPPENAPTAPATPTPPPTSQTTSTTSSGSPVATASRAPSAAPSAGATASAPTAGRPTATVTTAQAAPSGDAAVQALTAIADREQGRRPRAGQVIVHLQNRAVGTTDAFMRTPSGGATWSAADILAYHQEASARAGGAVLLKEGDNWVSATWNPSWTTREAAINWCYVAYPEFGRDYDNNNQLRSRCFVSSG